MFHGPEERALACIGWEAVLAEGKNWLSRLRQEETKNASRCVYFLKRGGICISWRNKYVLCWYQIKILKCGRVNAKFSNMQKFAKIARKLRWSSSQHRDWEKIHGDRCWCRDLIVFGAFPSLPGTLLPSTSYPPPRSVCCQPVYINNHVCIFSLLQKSGKPDYTQNGSNPSDFRGASEAW